MKLRSYLFFLLSIFFNNISAQKELADTPAQQLCLDQIFNTLNVDVSQYGPIAETVFAQASKQICFAGVTAQEIGEKELDISTQATINNNPATVNLRITPDKNFTLGAQLTVSQPLNTLVQQADVKNALSKADQYVQFANPAIIIANWNDPAQMFNTKVFSGLTFAGDIQGKDFVGESLTQVGLNKVKGIISIPKGVTSLKQVKFAFIPQDEPATGICLAKALIPITQKLNIQIATEVLGILNLICFGTNSGIAFDEEFNTVFFFEGPLKPINIGGKTFNVSDAMVKFQQAQDGNIVTVGIKPGSLNLADLDDSLKPISQFVAISNPVIAATNGTNQGIFDIDPEMGMVDPTLPTAVENLNKGVTLIADATFSGVVGNLLKAMQMQSDKIKIFIPAGAKTGKDIQISFVRTDKKAQQVCINDILGTVLNQIPANPILTQIQNICVTTQDVNIAQGADGSVALSFTGQTQILGQSANVQINAQQAKDGTINYTVGVQPSGVSYKLSQINTQLSPIDQQVQINNVTFIISNTATNISMFGIEHIKPGFIVAGDLNAQGFAQEVLQQIGLANVKVVATVPQGAKNIKQIQVAFYPVDEPATGICLARALIPITQQLGLSDFASQLTTILSLICFGTDTGMAFDQDFNMVFFFSGPLKPITIPGINKTINVNQAMVKFQQGESNIVTAGMQIGNLTFAEINQNLAPLDQLIQLKNVNLAATNGTNQGIFDIDVAQGMVDPTLPTAIEGLNKGMTLVADATVEGELGTLLSALQMQSEKIKIFIPSNAKSKDDVQISFIRTDKKVQTVCVKDILGAVLGQIPSNPVVTQIQNICVTTQDTNIQQGDDGSVAVSFIGQSQVLGQSANVQIRAQRAKDGTINYTVGVQPNVSYKLGQIDSTFNPVDQILQLNNTAFIISNTASTVPMFGWQNIQPGFTVLANGSVSGAPATFLAPLALDQFILALYVPQGAKSYKDAKINLQQAQPKPLCLKDALKPIIQQLDIGTADAIADQLEGICFGTEIGINIENNILNFFVAGNVKAGGQGIVKLKVTTDKQITVSVGYKYPETFSFTSVDQSLSFIDDVIKLSNPVLALTNGKGESLKYIDAQGNIVFDIENFDAGFMVIADVQGQGEFGNLLNLANFKDLVAQIIVPKNAKTAKDIEINIFPKSKDEKTTVCLGGLLGTITGPVLSNLLGNLNNNCITKKSMGFSRRVEGIGTTNPIQKIGIEFDGTLEILGQSNDVTLYLDYDHETKKTGVILFAQLADQNFALSKIASQFGIVDGTVTIQQPKLVIATQESDRDLLGFCKDVSVDEEIELEKFGFCKSTKGITLGGQAKFGKTIQNILDVFSISNLSVRATIPIDPSDIKDLQVEAFKKIDKSLGKDTMSLRVLDLLIAGGIPSPSISLRLDTDLQIPGTDVIPFLLQGSVSAEGFTLTGEAQGKVLNKPLNFPITLTDPIAQITSVGGTITGFGGGGKLQLSDKALDLYANINAVDPNKSAITGKASKLCLSDSFALLQLFATQSAGFSLQLPNIFCMSNVDIRIADEDTMIGTLEIPEGITLNGDVTFDAPLNISGKMRLWIKPPGLFDVLQSGINGSASVQIIDWGVLKITDSTGTQGPTLGVEVTTSDQKIWIDGQVNLAGIINLLTKVNIDKTGISFSADQQLFGLNATINAQAPLNNINNLGISYVLTQGITDLVKGALSSATNDINNGAQNSLNAISNTLNSIEDKCNQIPLISGIVCSPLDPAKGIVNQAQNVVNQIISQINNALNTFDIKQVTLSGSISDLQKKTMPQATIEFIIAGQTKTINLTNIALDDTQAFINAIVAAIKDILSPKDLLNQLSGFGSQIENLLSQAAQLLEQALKNAFANVGKQLEQAAVQVADATGKYTAEAGQAVAQAGEAAVQAANQAAQAASQAAEQASQAAEQAAQQAEKAAAAAAAEAVQAAEKAAQAAVAAAKKAAEAAAEAAKKAAEAVADAARKAASGISSIFHHHW